jgi:hypothetical protein
VGGSPLSNFVAQALIVLVLAIIVLLTLRTIFMVSMLTWSPLAMLVRRILGREPRDGEPQ